LGAAADLAATDVVPLVTWWLGQHPEVAAALGAGHVSMRNEAPWPCLVLTDTTAGSDGDLLHLTSPEIQLEAYGDLGGLPGKAALRKLLYTALGAMRELADQPWPYPDGAPEGCPVVTFVQSSRSGGWLPLASGQPRYIAGVRVFCHPAT
jgi:hypothetical protein